MITLLNPKTNFKSKSHPNTIDRETSHSYPVFRPASPRSNDGVCFPRQHCNIPFLQSLPTCSRPSSVIPQMTLPKYIFLALMHYSIPLVCSVLDVSLTHPYKKWDEDYNICVNASPHDHQTPPVLSQLTWSQLSSTEQPLPPLLLIH